MGDDKKLSEANFDRITSSVFQALANSFQFVSSWSIGDQEMYHRKMIHILKLDSAEDA
jgi:hypothetical protein